MASSSSSTWLPPDHPPYVIWSRRPSDPATAPAIIISPRARPPDDILRRALSSTETTPATSTGSPLSTNTSLSSAEEPTPKPIPAEEPTPKPIPAEEPKLKPTWASLLRNDAATPNALPTSSIVGFSVPADEPKSAPAPTQKPELATLLTASPHSHSAIHIRPRGLVNTGNMCFANAVLQVLVYCPPFWRLFNDIAKFVDTPSTPLVAATVRFLSEFIYKSKPPPDGKGKAVDRYADDDDTSLDAFIPTYVYDALKEKKRFDHMRGGHQEDAEEFLGFYLDTLEEELLSLVSKSDQNGHVPQQDGPWLQVGKRNRMAITRTSKSTDSPITRMFGGQFRSTLRVPHQKDSVLVEDWRSLRLDIQREQIYSIKDALAYISTPQPVQVTSVTRPGAILDATQTVHIDALPPILILHLKRFLYDASAGGVAKISKQVALSSELDVPPEVMVPEKKLHRTRYKLFGVLYHHGLSASGGHYTLDVLHPNIDNVHPSGPIKPREGWIRIDDELVSDVRSEDVFGSVPRDDRCAYLLFYRRVR